MPYTHRGLEKINRIIFAGEQTFDPAKWFLILADNTNPRTLSASNSNVSTLNDTINISGHGLRLGTKVRITGTPPIPLTTLADYYAIPTGANLFKLASSPLNALDNIAIDLTASGSSAFDVEVRPTVSNPDLFGHFLEHETQSPGYQRISLSPSIANFAVSPFNRVNNPTATVIVSAGATGISFTHAGILADGEETVGDGDGTLLLLYEQATLQEIPPLTSYTFALSIATLNPSFTTPGTN